MSSTSSRSDRIAVFLHSGEYDRMHQGLAIAAAGAASDRPVDVFFFWWALERLVRQRIDEPDFTPAREDVVDAFEARGAPTIRALLTHLKESGRATLYACSGSLPLLGLEAPRAAEQVDQIVGWSRILQLTAGVSDRFYL